MSSFFFLIQNHLDFNFQEFLIQNSLWENCFCDNFQSIYFNLYFFLRIEMHEQKCYFKDFLKLYKCFLNFLCKCEKFSLLICFAFFEQVYKQFSHARIIANKLLIKICEIKKYLYLSKHFKFWSIYNNVNLIEIYWHLIHTHNKFQELHLCDKKLALD